MESNKGLRLIESKIRLLELYMNFRIQMYQHCFDLLPGKRIQGRISISEIPSFDDFCDKMLGSSGNPKYIEVVDVIDGKLVKGATAGVGGHKGIAYRYFNYFRGIKYYTPMDDNFFFTEKLNDECKRIWS